jgi:Flp pilus assembly protein TadD/4-amino-4-deoxy-L-arabinose transferase-like glycosyltransferase
VGRRSRRGGRPAGAARSRPRRSSARPGAGSSPALGFGIFAFALAVRVLYLLESSDNPTFHTPISDAGTYDRIARSLAAGRPMGGDFFWQPVFYPAFLTAAHVASGSSVVFAKALQALLGGVTCVLVFLLGSRVFDRQAGILAALFTAVYAPLIFFEGELLATGWAALWSVGLILLLLRAGRRHSASTCFAVGICGALAILTRPTFLLFFVAACAWLALSQRRSGTAQRPAVRRLAALVAGFCLVVLPVAVQSQRVTGEFGFLPSSAWMNAHIGNNPDPCRTLGIRPGEEWDRLNLGPETSHAPVAASETRAWFRAKTLDYVRTEPISFLEGLLDKSLQLVSSRELPRNLDLYGFRQWSGLLTLLTWKAEGFGFPFGVLAPLAAAGLILGWRRIPVPLWLFVVLYPLSVVLVFVTARYRAPMVPVLCILAAAAVTSAIRSIRERRMLQLGLAAGIAGVVALLSAAPGPFCQELGSYESELHRLLGAERARRGEIRDAVRHFSRAVEIDPGNFDAHNDLAMAFDRQGRFDLAERESRLALALRPESAAAHTNLANALTASGRVEEALPLYRRALELRPAFPGAHLNLANTLMELGQGPEAVVHYRRELELRPDFPEAHYLLARALFRMGRPAEAVGHYRRALELRPNLAAVHYGLAGTLLSLDRSEEAIAHYRRVLEIDPSSRQAQQALRAALERQSVRERR